MAFATIMAEVDQLNLAGDRIEGLAEHHPPVSEALISIAGNVRTLRQRCWQCWWRRNCGAALNSALRFLRNRSNPVWQPRGAPDAFATQRPPPANSSYQSRHRRSLGSHRTFRHDPSRELVSVCVFQTLLPAIALASSSNRFQAGPPL
jgi:hypothetical protein